MRVHLAPEQAGRYPVWDKNAAHQVTWGLGTLEANLIAALRRRLLDADRGALDDKPLHPVRMAALADVSAWLAGELDHERLAALIPGLMLVRIPRGAEVGTERDIPLPAAYRVLKPFFCTDKQLHDSGLLSADRSLPIPSQLVRRLAAGATEGVLDDAVRRLRAAHIRVRLPRLAPGTTDGRRLLTALMVPIPDGDIQRLIPRAAHEDDRQVG